MLILLNSTIEEVFFLVVSLFCCGQATIFETSHHSSGKSENMTFTLGGRE